jgi:hypothetical protein
MINIDGECNKINHRIECFRCGYPYSEALLPDSTPEFSCDTPHEVLEEYINTQLDTYVIQVDNWIRKQDAHHTFDDALEILK